MELMRPSFRDHPRRTLLRRNCSTVPLRLRAS